MKPLIVLLTLALLMTAVRAQMLHGVTDALSGGGAPTPPADNGFLLEDGTSFLLLEDGSSKLCLEGGC